MKQLISFIDFILYTSLFTAACAVGLCMATERLIFPHDILKINQLHLLVFGAVLVVYNMKHVIRWWTKNEKYGKQYRIPGLILFGSGMVMSCYAILYMPLGVIIYSLLLAVLAFTYSWPILPLKGKRRLREFGPLKTGVLAGVWTIVTSVLPLLYHHMSVSDYPYEILLRFIFICTLCIIFDIRDMQADKEQNVSTLPNKVGIENCFRLIDMALIAFVALSVGQYLRYPMTDRIIGAVATAVATRIVAGYLHKHPSLRAYMGLADGVMLLYAALVVIY